MKHKVKYLFLAFFMPLLASFFVCYFRPEPVSAHTATLTTASSVSLTALTSHDGVAIDEESIEVETTCHAGYNLSIATSTSPELYLNGDGTSTATFTAVDGTATLANSTNKWGYTLTSNASSSTVFSPLSTTASVLRTTSQTASQTDIDDTFSIFYGTKADSSVTPGSYQMANSGAIVYYLTMDATCATVDIAYDGNNADAGTMGAVGTGVIHTGVRDGDTVSLITSNFSRTGYGFAGWSFDSNAGAKLVDNDTTNNPIVYGPQEDATMPADLLGYDTDEDGIVKLYAVWIPSQGNLQGWTGCTNLDTATYDSTTGALDITKNSITALTDQRDNDTYAVARLADGNCWMIENLRLDNAAQLTIYNTNNPLNSGANVALKHNYADTMTYDTLSATSSDTTSWCTSSNSTCDDQSRLRTDNTAKRASNPTTNSVNIYSYGNYYNWYSATAGQGTYSMSSGNTIGDICPSGWHLPTGTGSGEFGLLSNSLGGYKNASNVAQNMTSNTTPTGTVMSKVFRHFPNNFVYSGNINGALINNRGSYGYYSSSTAGSNGGESGFQFASTTVSPNSGGDYKYRGKSVRCIASAPTNYTLSYNANGGTDAPNSQTTTANGIATFTVSDTIPTRSGYTFAGWIDEYGNEVQPNGTFRTKDVNAVLYARWTNNSCNPTANTIGAGNVSTDAVCLQDVTPSMKSSLPTADSSSGTYSLIDARDGQSYTIAKLVDGNLWLTKNLNYGSNNDTLLTSYDTDLPSGATFMAPASTTNFETTNSSTTYISPKILTDSSYGGYYSFAAAIASTDAYSASSQNITTSICPKGWDLPTGVAYDNLRSISGNTTYAKMNAAPYSFIYAGYRNGTSFSSQTSSVRLWTSTNYNSSNAHYTTAYGTASYDYKRYGESVRCIASNGTATINYNANGGSGSMANQANVDINGTAISSSSFTAPTNKQFRNWNTSANGTGTTITPGTLLSFIASDGDTITLYAQWDEVYYIAFDANGGSGTMSNQTVVRDTATSIATSTFTRSGYIFYGWNTQADGNGTFYSDRQKVTNLTTTGNTITLYAVWIEGAYLDTGSAVNQKLKRLAGNSSASYTTQDNTITAIIRSSTLPNDFTPATANTISHNSSPTPIYAWYNSTNKTIYYYSAATNILMNSSSPYFFYNMRALSDLSTISTWDTTKLAGMREMFEYTGYSASTFTLDLSSWRTSSVTIMADTFHYTGYSASTFTLNLSSWDTSNVTDMTNMFYSAGEESATWSISGLSQWDTSNVTDMSSMFYHAGHNASSFTLNLSSWKTSKVTNMQRMFSDSGYNAPDWSVGDLSSWNTSNVTDMSYMFSITGQVNTDWSVGDLSSWDTSSVTNMAAMFNNAGVNATTWSVGNIASWDTSSVTNMMQVFYAAGQHSTTFILDLSSWDTSNVTDMFQMFFVAGYYATTWSITIPKTNNGTTTGPISNTTSNLYGKTTSVTDTPPSGKSFTLAN